MPTSKATKVLGQIRKALKENPQQPANQVGIEQALAKCLAEIQELLRSDTIFLPRSVAEDLLSALETMPEPLNNASTQSIVRHLRAQLECG
jgi:hypothetical protein